jgi:hypothetical protein
MHIAELVRVADAMDVIDPASRHANRYDGHHRAGLHHDDPGFAIDVGNLEGASRPGEGTVKQTRDGSRTWRCSAGSTPNRDGSSEATTTSRIRIGHILRRGMAEP